MSIFSARNSVLAVGLLCGFATSSFANTVAVWNSQLAVANSNYAKAKIATIQATINPQQQQLQSYKANIERLQAQYNAQKATMTDAQKQSIRTQIQSNLDNYDRVANQIQNTLNTHETDVMQKIAPKIQGITDALIKQKNIDILLDNRDRSVTFVKPEWDITADVTQKINEQVK